MSVGRECFVPDALDERPPVDAVGRGVDLGDQVRHRRRRVVGQPRRQIGAGVVRVAQVQVEVADAGGARHQARHVDVVDPEEGYRVGGVEQAARQRRLQHVGQSRTKGWVRLAGVLTSRRRPLAGALDAAAVRLDAARQRRVFAGHRRRRRRRRGRWCPEAAQQQPPKLLDVDEGVVVGFQHVGRLGAVLRRPFQAHLFPSPNASEKKKNLIQQTHWYLQSELNLNSNQHDS